MLRITFCILFFVSHFGFSQRLTFDDLFALGSDTKSIDSKLSLKGFELESSKESGITYVLNSDNERDREFVSFEYKNDIASISYLLLNINSYNNLMAIINDSTLKLIKSGYELDDSHFSMYRGDSFAIFVLKQKKVVLNKDTYMYIFTIIPEN